MNRQASFDFGALGVGQRRHILGLRRDAVPQFFGQLDSLRRAQLEQFGQRVLMPRALLRTRQTFDFRRIYADGQAPCRADDA
jgi:hypothetical protein